MWHDIYIKRMAMRHPFFVLLTFIFLSTSGFGKITSFEFTPELTQAYNDVCELKIIDTTLLDKENGVSLYIKNLHTISHILCRDDHQLFSSSKHLEKAFLKELEKTDVESPYKDFIKAEIKVSWAFVYLNFSEELKAGTRFKESYSLTKKLLIDHKNFLPAYKTMGLFEVIIGNIPSDMQWLSNSIGIKGSIPRGIKLLNKVGNSSSIFRNEARVELALIHAYVLGDNSEAQNITDDMLLTSPSNPLLLYIKANLLNHGRQNDECLTVLLKIKTQKNRIPIGMTDYLLGESYLNNLKYEESIKAFTTFIGSAGYYKNNMNSAYYKLYIAFELKDGNGKQFLDLVDKRQKGLTYPDKYAVMFVKNEVYSSIPNMKARLLLDGGYNNLALKTLLSIEDFKNKHDQTEHHYRLARTYHFTGILSKAVEHYEKCIQVSHYEDPWYYAANSHLQLGHIYKTRKKEVAIKHFKLVKKYTEHAYKGSLKDKAKHMLEELED